MYYMCAHPRGEGAEDGAVPEPEAPDAGEVLPKADEPPTLAAPEADGNEGAEGEEEEPAEQDPALEDDKNVD